MDVLELKRQYESLSDEELLRVWADEEGLTDIARSVLSEEMARRGLLNDPRSFARKVELKQELAQTQERYKRQQRRMIRRWAIFLIGALVSAVIVVLRLLSR
jgi:dsDNA-specific endonuclease/ATPase MutS2